MTPCWKHLLNLKYDSDPLFYLKVHEAGITTSIVRDREIDDRWTELKIVIEEGDIKPYSKYEPKFSTDYCKGFDAALEWVEGQMKWLEEK